MGRLFTSYIAVPGFIFADASYAFDDFLFNLLHSGRKVYSRSLCMIF